MTLRPSRSTTIALLLSPVGILLISATRLLIISDYNPATASTIVSSGSYIDTLLGTFIPLVPVFMPYLALILLFFNRVIVSILALLAAAFVSPTSVTLPGAIHIAHDQWQTAANYVHAHTVIQVAGVIFLLLFSIELSDLEFYNLLKAIAPVLSLILIPFIYQIYPLPLNNNNNYYSNLIRQPWLPAVRLTLRSGQEVVGYTLSTGDKWFVVLLDRTRKVRYIHEGDVAKQRVCQISKAMAAKPLISLIPVVPTIQMCKQPRSASVVRWQIIPALTGGLGLGEAEATGQTLTQHQDTKRLYL